MQPICLCAFIYVPREGDMDTKFYLNPSFCLEVIAKMFVSFVKFDTLYLFYDARQRHIVNYTLF